MTYVLTTIRLENRLYNHVKESNKEVSEFSSCSKTTLYERINCKDLKTVDKWIRYYITATNTNKHKFLMDYEVKEICEKHFPLESKFY